MVWETTALQRLIAGDEDAIRLFVNSFESRFAALARRRSIPAHDCATVAHDAISDCVQQIRAGRLREPSKLTAFVHAILNNKINDYWRRRGPSMLALEELPETRDTALLTAPPSDDVLMVQQVMSRLDPEDQLVLWLHDAERHTLEEIGTVMHLKKSAVSERLKRARERFRAETRAAGSFARRARLEE